MLLTAQVVRGSVGSPNVMVGDRLYLASCTFDFRSFSLAIDYTGRQVDGNLFRYFQTEAF